MKKVLIVAVHVPPSAEVGIYRTTAFAERLIAEGLWPIVLTMKPWVYQNIDSDLAHKEDGMGSVYRAFSLNAKRHLALFGRHFSFQTIPDEWWPWQFAAVAMGKQIIRRHGPELIWSTYPFISAHLVAQRLASWSRLPWVADYRDPLEFHDGASSGKRSRINIELDSKIVRDCSLAVFVTKQARDFYADLYPPFADKFEFIENGFDQSLDIRHSSEDSAGGRKEFLYSGSLYPSGRDPTPIFDAIRILNEASVITPNDFILSFRGASDPGRYAEAIEQRGIGELVRFLPRCTFRESVEEMMTAHSLVLLQGDEFNLQIPGKVYEYLRTGRPIIALTPREGATGELLSKFDGVFVGEDPREIARSISNIAEGRVPSHFDRDLAGHSRAEQMRKYVQLLRSRFAALA